MNEHLDIDPSDFLMHRSWQQAVDELQREYSGIAYCATEGAPERFDYSVRRAPYTIVSGYSDYCVCEQEKHHPNEDLMKMNLRVNWRGAMSERETYYQVPVGPCCDTKRCCPWEKYSLKIDSHTCATFPDLPETVKAWWVTNLNVVHPRMKFLPFGMNDDDTGEKWEGRRLFPELRSTPKTRLLYVNFQDNTSERMYLKRHFQNCPWVTFRPAVGLPYPEFLAEMASHKFVLSPPGNGLDCYRNYEAMYLGCVPLLQDSIFARHFVSAGFPAVAIDDYRGLDPSNLMQLHDRVLNGKFNWDALKVSWWKERIRESL